ncbi:UNVERIFIED_CONTAM: hypothetical protein FKN15_002794, partial [Acipenser sinensis]
DSKAIVDGNLKLILGLVWTLILHYSISMPVWEDEGDEDAKKQTPKQRLLGWIQNKIPYLPITNFSRDWQDGRTLGALVDSCAPGLCPDWENWDGAKPVDNAREAMQQADDWLGIPQCSVQADQSFWYEAGQCSVQTDQNFWYEACQCSVQTDQSFWYEAGQCSVQADQSFWYEAGQCSVQVDQGFWYEAGQCSVQVITPEEIIDPDVDEHSVMTYLSQFPKAKLKPGAPLKPKLNPKKARAYGPGIEPSGNTVLRPAVFTVDTVSAGQGELTVYIEDPAGTRKEVKPVPNNDKNKTYTVTYIPQVSGMHKVVVFFAGQHISKSPFEVNIEKAQGDASKVTAKGPGLESTGNIANKPTYFDISTAEGSHCVVFASTDTLRCFKCGAHGHQRKNCPVRESEGVQEGQGEIGGEAVRDDRGEQEDEPLQSEISAGPSEQAETAVQFAGQENKDGDTADNQGFIMVEKRKRNKKTDKTVKENESVLERSSGAVSSDLGLAQHTRFEAGGGGVVPGSDRRLRSGLGGHGTAGVESRGVGAPDSNPGGSHGSSGSQLGAAVPPCSEGEEHSAESLLGAAVNPSLPDSPQSAVVEAGEENLKTATVTVENDSNDEYEEEMNEAEEGEASDSSLFSNIPDSQTAKKKLYSANEIGAGMGDVAVVIADPQGSRNTVEGSRNTVEVMIEDKGSSVYRCTYRPAQPGAHTLDIAFGGEPIPKSPYRVNIGEGAGMGDVAVVIADPQGSRNTVEVMIEDKGSSVYRCTYRPAQPGAHTLDIAFGGEPIHKSPYRVNIGEGFAIEGPSQAKIECDDQNDGSCNVSYWPTEVGEYAVHVMCDDEDIEDSPFMALIKPASATCNPDKVSAYGPSLEKSGCVVNQPGEFTVDAKEAGKAALKIYAQDSEGIPVPVQVKNNGDGTYACSYTPTKAIKHTLAVAWGEGSVPNSPFRVSVGKGSHPQRVKVFGPGVERSGLKANEPTHFTVDCTEAGEGDVSIGIKCDAHVISENEEDIDFDIIPNMNDTITVKYTPPAAGRYTLKVLFTGQEIPISPFRVKVEPSHDASKVRAEGPGLNKSGVESEKPTHFTVFTKGAGKAPLDVQFSAPLKGEAVRDFEIIDNYDYSHTVKYTPVQQGSLGVVVMYGGDPIPRSPFSVGVAAPLELSRVAVNNLESRVEVGKDQEFSVSTKGAGGQGRVEAVITSPANKAVPCVVEPQPGKDSSLVKYIPKEEGFYSLDLSYDGSPIPGSPFLVEATLPPDPSKVKAYGPGLQGGLVGSPAEFMIDTKGAGTGGLGLTVEGPCEAKIECSDNGDGTCSVSYLPTEQGEYLVNILFQEVHIPGSPFSADVTLPFDPAKVVASGPGLQRGKVGEAGLLRVDCSRAGPGELALEAVSDSGAKAEPHMEDHGAAGFILHMHGSVLCVHALAVMFDDVPVPGSPFQVGVAEGCDPRRVQAHGPGLQEALTHKPNKFTVVTRGAGIGGLGITVEGPSESKMSCKDNKDGSCSVEYTPYTPGMYDVNITYEGQHVPGSPFKVPVKDVVDPSKVQLSGPGLGLGARHAANQELQRRRTTQLWAALVGSGIAWTRTGDLQAIGRILHSTRSAFTGCATQELPKMLTDLKNGMICTV